MKGSKKESLNKSQEEKMIKKIQTSIRILQKIGNSIFNENDLLKAKNSMIILESEVAEMGRSFREIYNDSNNLGDSNENNSNI